MEARVRKAADSASMAPKLVPTRVHIVQGELAWSVKRRRSGGYVLEEIHRQLALWGSETLIRNAEAIPSIAERRREIRLIEHASAVMGELSEDDLSFVHSGLCQTALPQSASRLERRHLATQ